MTQLISELLLIIEEFWWLGILSIVAFPLTIIILPLVIIRLPADYFSIKKADGFISRQRTSIRFLLLLFKNLGGASLLLMGILMLVMPGQGLLTIFAGISVMNFPGKRKLELKIALNRKVFKGLNWIRRKSRNKEFIFPENKR